MSRYSETNDSQMNENSDLTYTPPGSPTRNMERENNSNQSEIGKLAEALALAIQKGSNQSNQVSNSMFLNKDILSEFDPSRKTMTSERWIEKINNTAQVYGWNDKVKVYMAVCKLKGNAKRWYDDLDEALPWKEFSEELVIQFPKDFQFGTALREATNYTHEDGQDLETYCVRKLGKIQKLKLNFTEEQKVGFVLDGIRDEQIKKTVLASKCQSIADLKKIFTVFDTASDKRERRPQGNKNFHERQRGRKRDYNHYDRQFQNSDNNDKSKIQKIQCYKCSGFGHISRNCPKSGEDLKSRNEKTSLHCTHCKTNTHNTENCWSLKKKNKQNKSEK